MSKFCGDWCCEHEHKRDHQDIGDYATPAVSKPRKRGPVFEKLPDAELIPGSTKRSQKD